ncbi:GntR family transcriptional regulator [Thermanaeromonas sp. C210]|uniref:GntR family transcriptional regulator n=1 Tax=Thermanaeromonas sp. C210 TaxID=2731925 RepID=UPI00155C240B|nr:GntR family transcriptional regulator [Thermanaeromonas sp. C210]GFN21794.1 putative HTH-type transcriptional regulator YmfC [Thermanaeromonas sp. C210]
MQKLHLTPLYMKAKEAIIDMIQKGRFPENRLPPEEELAEKLGISRATIREALMILAREGVVSKKHGVGNFAHPSALENRMRIDLISDIARLLKASGYEVAVEHRNFREGELAPAIAEKLRLAPGETPLYIFDRLYLADGRPAVFITIRIPRIHVVNDIRNLPAGPTIVDVLKACCNAEPSHSILTFQPLSADAPLAEIFELPEDHPLISWEELFFDLYDRRLCYNTIVFHPRIVQLSMLRKWGR